MSKTIYEVLKEKIDNSENNVIACKYNNEVKSLDREYEDKTDIKLIDLTNRDGMRIYTRGLLYIMAKAFHETYRDLRISVKYGLTDAMYCEIYDTETTDEIINNIKTKMQEIIDKNLEIKKVVMSNEEAIAFYEKEKNTIGKLQITGAKQREHILLYYCEDYYNYFYGVMPINTGFMKIYDIVKYADGFLIRYPSRTNPGKLEEYKETKKLLNTFNDYKDINNILKVNNIYDLNKIVKSCNIEELVLTAESLHEKKIAEIANQIAASKKRIILIAGPSSSGKTTFAQRLGVQLKLNGLKEVIISVDNYFLDRADTPKHDDGSYDFECIEAIDMKLLNTDLKKLLNGEEIEPPEFDFNQGKKIYPGNKLKLEQNEVLVLEGIHCLNDKLTSEISKDDKFKIYMAALTVLNVDQYNRISTTDNRILRRMVRDSKFRSHSALATLKMWPSVTRGEEKNIYPFAEDSDVMFNSSLVYELGVLKDYVLPLLEEIDNTNEEYSEARRLYEFMSYFESIPIDCIPRNSIMREFIGEGSFYR